MLLKLELMYQLLTEKFLELMRRKLMYLLLIQNYLILELMKLKLMLMQNWVLERMRWMLMYLLLMQNYWFLVLMIWKLVMQGGGDRSNLACAGSRTSAGARQLSNLTETLYSCQSDIYRNCDLSNWPQTNMTFISECAELVSKFNAGAGECLGKVVGSQTTSNADACSCWDSFSLSKTVESVRMCKASTAADLVTAAVKNCSATFMKCRKYEDDAITTLMSCKSNPETLIKQVI